MKLERPQVHTYSDYRRFLLDMYKFRKEGNVGFSFEFISSKIGTSRSYLKNIMDGRRHLSIDKISAVGKAFKLDKSEMDYFSVLVLKDICEEPLLKDLLKEILRSFAS
ncbi:MAG: TIGR02147 family protein [Bdellovibrio sp.]|nr:TIGR02147 family protein [Bdellovibrio sp.]